MGLDADSLKILWADTEIISTLADRPDGPVILSCGDDRPASLKSQQYLISQGLPASTVYMRYFGGLYGVARIIMIAAAVQYGQKSLGIINYGGNFKKFAVRLKDQIETATQVSAITHSAAGSEAGDSQLNPNTDKPLACAYAANIGKVASIANREDIQRLAASEYLSLFGAEADPDNVYQAAETNKLIADTEFGKNPEEFTISRQDIINDNIPAMILEGSHTPSQKTFLLANFAADKLSDPSAAKSIGRPYYGIDFTQVAETILKSFPNIKLDPTVLMATMILDVCATRAALASNDGTADPNRITLIKYGDPHEALDHLRRAQSKVAPAT